MHRDRSDAAAAGSYYIASSALFVLRDSHRGAIPCAGRHLAPGQ